MKLLSPCRRHYRRHAGGNGASSDLVMMMKPSLLVSLPCFLLLLLLLLSWSTSSDALISSSSSLSPLLQRTFTGGNRNLLSPSTITSLPRSVVVSPTTTKTTTTTATTMASSSSSSSTTALSASLGSGVVRVVGGSKAAPIAVKTTFAGKLWPILSKFQIGPMKAKEIITSIVFHTHWLDIVVLGFIAYGIQPLVKFTYDRSSMMMMESNNDDESSTKAISNVLPLSQRKRFRISTIISQLGKVGLSVYIVDILCIILQTMGFTFPSKFHINEVYAKTAYSTWVVKQFLSFKTIALCRIFKVRQDNMGRVDVLDRILNGLSISVVALLLFDWLSLQMGMAIKGLFAFGSVGTLAFTLASQGLVSQLISGFFLSASNKAYTGDDVKFGDGTSGKILKMGWMETVLRNGDNTITSIPNSQLASQKVSNLSRVRMAQIKQTLRFHYNDADIIPELLQTIQKEIEQSCPHVITNGSRPFRIYFTNFNEDHLEVMVDTHHMIKPIGDEYWKNRQLLLLAIHRAVKHHNIQFAQLVRYEAPGQNPQWRVVGSNSNSMVEEEDLEDAIRRNENHNKDSIEAGRSSATTTKN